jgi:hypothetical protein
MPSSRVLLQQRPSKRRTSKRKEQKIKKNLDFSFSEKEESVFGSVFLRQNSICESVFVKLNDKIIVHNFASNYFGAKIFGNSVFDFERSGSDVRRDAVDMQLTRNRM